MARTKHFIRQSSAHSLATLKGHLLARKYLETAHAGGSLPHAILLHGASGTGKLAAAYGIVKKLNCPMGGPADCPCNTCRKISEGVFADVLVIEPTGATGQITLNGWKSGKDDPDNLQYYRFVDTRPMEGGRKVLIIKRAERMGVSFANYLLKLLEEPPSYLVIVLTARRRAEVLQTIRSRCAPVRLGPLDEEEMRELASTWFPNIDARERDILVRSAQGRPGLLAEQAEDFSRDRRQSVATAMSRFADGGFPALFGVAADLDKLGELIKTRTDGTARDALEGILQELLGWYRDAILLKTQPEAGPERLSHPDGEAEVRAYSTKYPIELLALAAEKVQSYREFAGRQTDRRYVMEVLLLELGKLLSSRPQSIK